MSTPVQLETKRLLLRPWRQEDAAALFACASDPQVGPMAGWKPHETLEESREIIRTVLSEPETYAVFCREDGCLAGSASLFPSKAEGAEPGEWEIGYWIARPLWGRGYAPEAVQALLRRGFLELGSLRIWCGYFDGNEASRRVQEKCGFQYHHTQKDVFCPAIDAHKTEHFTCLTREAWLLANRTGE